VAYFDLQRPGLGERFERELLKVVTTIEQRPLIGTPLTGLVRLLRLETFRYNVIYVIEDSEALIVAVPHHRRRPGYWIARLR
jgi:toxin ParE1/3/4